MAAMMRAARTIFSLEIKELVVYFLRVRIQLLPSSQPAIKKNSPGLANVDDIDTISTGLPEVVLHVNLQVLASQVSLGSQEHLNVLAGSVENGRQVVGGHLDGWNSW